MCRRALAGLERFAALNDLVQSRHGWVASVPGDVQARNELRALGYDVREIEQGERILPTAIIETLVAGAGGELVPLVEGSTRPVAQVRTHAGIVKVTRFAFTMP